MIHTIASAAHLCKNDAAGGYVFLSQLAAGDRALAGIGGGSRLGLKTSSARPEAGGEVKVGSTVGGELFAIDAAFNSARRVS